MTVRRAAALLGVALLAVGCSTAAPTATVPATIEPSQAPIPSAGPTLTTSPAETSAPTNATPTAATTLEPTAAPSGTPKPTVVSLKVPGSPSCTSDNGTGTIGYIHISWTATGTDGVRLSIDPPTAATAYGSGYADYPASGSADVPFACNPPNSDAKGSYHLYVVTTIHAAGAYYSYRFAKAYQAN